MDVALGFDPGRGEFDSHYPCHKFMCTFNRDYCIMSLLNNFVQ